MNRVSSPTQGRFEGIYQEYKLEVLADCARRVGHGEAADACSEVFLVAWRRLDDLPAPPQTLPYLYGIAHNVVSNHFRSLRRRGRLDARLAQLGLVDMPDPAIFVVQNSRDTEIVTAVRNLKAKDREIVMLYAWEDLSRETIAEMMGMTRAAIDQRIHRANQKLARALEPRAQKTPSPSIAQEGETWAHEVIDRLVRPANPVPDPRRLSSIDVPVLHEQRRDEVQTQIDTDQLKQGRTGRSLLIGLAAAVALP